ncbi:MAG: ABC transporter permease, partial [Parvibaculaceae bacterium]
MFWQVMFSIAAAQLTYRRRQTIVSTLGVALGVGFFIAASAVMSGSEKDLVQQLVDNAPHITMKDEFRTAAKQPVHIAFPGAAVDLTNTKPREYLRGIKNHGAIVDE